MSRNLSFMYRLHRLRTGNSTAAVSIGLFLLSVCLAALLYGWMTRNGTAQKQSDTYRFEQTNEELPPIRSWHHVEDFPAAIAQLDSVFWEPDDTLSMRKYLKESGKLTNADILEIGCGTGLVSIACALQGARSVVATDINYAAVGNTTYNAELCGVTKRIKVRKVNAERPHPFEVISAEEKFDFVVSNPPWEDQPVTSAASYAFYDPGFKLLDGILTNAQSHLKPDGKVLLAYGCRTAIERVRKEAPGRGWQVQIVDDRNLEELPEVFLPGMLIELTPCDGPFNEAIHSNEYNSRSRAPVD
jgi:release factor glutamine methyltransferase